MVSQSDFDGLQNDLKRRAGTALDQAAAVRRAYNALQWTGPSRNDHEAANQRALQLLGTLEQTLSDAASQAGNVAQDFATAINDLAKMASGVKDWLQSEGKGLLHDLESLVSAVDAAALKYFGVREADLPAPDDPKWYGLYDTARRNGMTVVV
jgi:uncharacterized membrane protein YccC